MLMLSLLAIGVAIEVIVRVLLAVYALAIEADEESNIEALDASEKDQDDSL